MAIPLPMPGPLRRDTTLPPTRHVVPIRGAKRTSSTFTDTAITVAAVACFSCIGPPLSDNFRTSDRGLLLTRCPRILRQAFGYCQSRVNISSHPLCNGFVQEILKKELTCAGAANTNLQTEEAAEDVVVHA